MAAHYFFLLFSAVPPWYVKHPRAGTVAAPPTKGREAEPAPSKLQKKPDTRSPRVTTPLGSPLRPPPPPPLHPHYPNFPPPVEPFSRHGYFARSLGLPGCTYHPPVGRPRATSASPSSSPP